MLKFAAAWLTVGLLYGPCTGFGENLLNNGSFEEASAGDGRRAAVWQVDSGREPLEIHPEHYEGKLGAMILGDGKLHSWRQDVIAPKGSAWTLSAVVKGSEVVMEESDYAYVYGHILLEGRPYDQTEHFFIPLPKGSSDWDHLRVEGKVPKGAKVEKIQVTVSGKFKSGRFYVDDVSLSELDVLKSEAGYLTKKIEDLERGLKSIGDVDKSVAAALAELAAAKQSLAVDSPDVAKGKAHWEKASKVVSHKAWSTLYPDAMSDKPIEAQMIYHGHAQTKEGCDAWLDKLELAGANGVFLSFGSWMYVTYHSELLPVEAGWESFDSLAYFIEEAHRRGIKVFGYVATFYGTSEVQALPKSLATDHPEWLAKGPDPYMPTFPDPANEQVVDFMVKVYQELASKYKLDGVGLDYIRYPTPTSLNYDENNRQKILDRYGIDILAHENLLGDKQAWAKVQEYRRENVANVVRRVTAGLREIRPEISVMACLISEREIARDDYGQDWAVSSKWMDLASPMNYDDRALDGPMLEEQSNAFNKTGAKFIPAVGGMPVCHEAWTISDWAKRLAFTRKYDPDGIIVYRIGDLDPAVAAFFGKGPFYSQAEFPTSAKR